MISKAYFTSKENHRGKNFETKFNLAINLPSHDTVVILLLCACLALKNTKKSSLAFIFRRDFLVDL